MCIKNHTDMVTSSYVSPELQVGIGDERSRQSISLTTTMTSSECPPIQALDGAAKDAGITIMNESGLDPGIDHMLAMECFDRVREHGGKVR